MAKDSRSATPRICLPRREFLLGSLASGLLAGCARGCGGPAVLAADESRPKIPYGVQIGDPTRSGVILWSRADRPSRLCVEWGTEPNLRDAIRLSGPIATPASDFTARLELSGLPHGRRIHYRVWFESDEGKHAQSEPVFGSFRAPPGPGEDVTIVWSGDMAGQGYGIDTSRGGMKTFAAIAAVLPDVFIHSGDRIYADGPLPERITLPDGSVWKNLVTPAKAVVAETLDDFRGNYAYNMLDEHVRRLHQSAMTIVCWDDHEVHNDWYPGLFLDDERYREKRVSVLSARARQAMLDYSPMREGPIRRVLSMGPHADIFVLDARSFRSPNGRNREPSGSAMLGTEQLGWLMGALETSSATWKIIACEQPIGVICSDGEHEECFGNADGEPLGREKEIASLLSFLKERRIRNVVFVTADVHYAAAHRYDPSRAQFRDFDPFWEFVAGPLHAATFGPNSLDGTFGPELVYSNAPTRKEWEAPNGINQSFGVLSIDGKTGALRVSLRDGNGKELWRNDLDAVA